MCRQYFELSIALEDGRLDGPADIRFISLKHIDSTSDSAMVSDSGAGAIDGEGIAACRTDDLAADADIGGIGALASSVLFVSTEDPPRVVEVDKASGAVVPPPKGLAIDFASQTPLSPTTVIHNKQLESLTCGGGVLYTANEGPLTVDGEPATHVSVGSVRIFTFDVDAGKLVHTARYDLEPSAFEDCDSTGLVDLEVLRPGAAGAGGALLLAMERCYSRTRGNSIKVFAVDLSAAADISGCKSFASGCADGAAVPKIPVVDLSDVETLEGADLMLDNYEGIALGPTLADGRQMLLLVNDDNYNHHQIGTQFVAFAITVLDKVLDEALALSEKAEHFNERADILRWRSRQNEARTRRPSRWGGGL